MAPYKLTAVAQYMIFYRGDHIINLVEFHEPSIFHSTHEKCGLAVHLPAVIFIAAVHNPLHPFLIGEVPGDGLFYTFFK